MTKGKEKKRSHLIILDAHAILHRAYHALPGFTTSHGEPTGCLYGLTSILLKMIAEQKPDHIVAAYDLPEPTFRKQLYDQYKAKRAEMDEDLIRQIERSRDILTAFNIPIYQAAGFEADDIIGTIIDQVSAVSGLKVTIASGDMDTMQLVDDDRVVVCTLKRGVGDTVVYNESAVVDRFGFSPGYLVDFKGLSGDPSDNIVGVPGVGEKTATSLIKSFGSIEKVYEALKTDREKFLAAGFKPRIADILRDHEDEAFFSKTLATIRRDAPIEFRFPEKTWEEGFDQEAVRSVLFELEFKTFNRRLEDLVPERKKNEQLTKEEVGQTELLEAAIGLWLLDSDRVRPGLQEIFDFAGVRDLKKAREYIFDQLTATGLVFVFEKIEKPLIPLVRAAEERGILVDRDHFTRLSDDYNKKLIKLIKEVHKLAGREFNVNSPKQLSEVLFGDLGLPVKGVKKTAGGELSTRESELVKLKDKHPIIEKILSHREIQKLLSTYINTIPQKLDSQGRLHTHLHQAGTTTGRMSSADPNLQNIPVREGLGSAIRKGFIATSGHKWVAIDYSQIEMRVLAMLSGDPALGEIFKKDKDVHGSVASLVFGVAEEEVTKEMRRKAKVINFGIIYGMGVNALRVNLGSTQAEAKKFYDDYFAAFPTIRQYFDQVVVEARERGYTETMFGRRRYFPGLRSPVPYIKASAERQAYNAPLQGTAADIVKLATIAADDKLKQAGLIDRVHFLLQVHDELIYEVDEKVLSEAILVVKEAMEGVVDLPIPLKVETSVGDNWGELTLYHPDGDNR